MQHPKATAEQIQEAAVGALRVGTQDMAWYELPDLLEGRGPLGAPMYGDVERRLEIGMRAGLFPAATPFERAKIRRALIDGAHTVLRLRYRDALIDEPPLYPASDHDLLEPYLGQFRELCETTGRADVAWDVVGMMEFARLAMKVAGDTHGWRLTIVNTLLKSLGHREIENLL